MQPGEPTPAYQTTAQTPLSTSAHPHHSHAKPAAHPSDLSSPAASHPHHHRRQPASPHTTELPPLSTALYTAPKSSSYYDPTSDHGLGQPHPPQARFDATHSSQVPISTPLPTPCCIARVPSPVALRRQNLLPTPSRVHACTRPSLTSPPQTREPHAYPDARHPESPYANSNHSYRSPVASSFAQRSPLQHPPSHGHMAGNMEAMSHSPVSPTVYQSMNRGAVQPPPPQYERRPSVKDEVNANAPLTLTQSLTSQQAPPPAPKRDPMSLSSIMDSGADPAPPTKPQPLPSYSKPSPNPLFVKQEALTSPAPAELPYADAARSHRGSAYEDMPPIGSAPPVSRIVARELPAPDEAEVEAALTHIETNEMKDADILGMDHHREREEYTLQTRKRLLDLEQTESGKRKVCRHVCRFL